jgi:malonyl-CoA decarboxylase
MQNFATLSPIPGLMQWLLAKLASQIKLSEAESREGNSLGACSTFKESILLPDEERMIHDAMYVRSEAMSEIELHANTILVLCFYVF